MNIEKAKNFAHNKKHLEAIKILVPCLKQPVQVKSKELEECLYQGGRIFEEAFSQKYISLNANLLAEYQKLQLHVSVYLYSPEITHNDFFGSLVWLFPNSKYMDIAEYESIGWAYNDLDKVLGIADSLENYLKNSQMEDVPLKQLWI